MSVNYFDVLLNFLNNSRNSFLAENKADYDNLVCLFTNFEKFDYNV